MNTNGRKRSFYSRGKTVFIGNGLNRVFNNGCSWDELFGKSTKENSDSIPYPLKVRFYETNVKDIIDKLEQTFIISDGYISIIHSFVNNGFLNFITTNYTYEIEYSLLPPKKRNYDYILKNTFSMAHDNLNKQSFICNYVQIPYQGKLINIFHIHGEIRKVSSIVLDHNKYCRLIGEIHDYEFNSIFKVNKLGYDYNTYAYKTWIDLFLLNDIYIVGYGLDYSEIDIWWIFEKRNKYDLKHKNRIYIYLHLEEFNNPKRKLLKKENIKVVRMGVKPATAVEYKDYYHLVINDIFSKYSNE